MKICIVGGGIGGLATAVALQARGFDAQVHETAAELAPVGKGIWVPTNAMLVLDRLSLGDAVAARGVALERIEVRDVDRRVIQALDLEAVRARFGRTTISIRRADLQAVLAEALAPGTLRLGRQCVGVRREHGATIVRFGDGEEIVADLVVGADGLRSIVREAVEPGVELRYAGQTCYLGMAHARLPAELQRTVWEVWGGRRRFGFSSVGQDTVYWFAPMTAPMRGTARAILEPEMNELRAGYAGFPHPIPELLARSEAGTTMRVDLHDFQPIGRWHDGRVVLVGDAAHGMMPNLGQGGAQAIEDAHALATALDAEPDVQRALVRYERVRRPKASRIVRTAWWMGKLAHLEGRWPRRLRDAVLRSTPDAVSQRQIDALYSVPPA